MNLFIVKQRKEIFPLFKNLDWRHNSLNLEPVFFAFGEKNKKTQCFFIEFFKTECGFFFSTEKFIPNIKTALNLGPRLNLF